MLCQLPDRPGLRFGSYGKVVPQISMCTYTDIQDILWPENFLSRNVSKCQAYITHGTWTIGIGGIGLRKVVGPLKVLWCLFHAKFRLKVFLVGRPYYIRYLRTNCRYRKQLSV